MSAITFDTLKFVHRLRAAGVPEPQAEAFAEAFKDASGEADLATTGDISRMEGSTKADIKDVKAELKAEIGDVKAELAVVKAELAIVKWMVGGIGFGVLLLVLKSFVPGFSH